MNPRTPDILSRLVGIADTMVREQDAGALRPNGMRAAELGQIYGELSTLRTPATEAGFDEAALLLCHCLILLDERGGPLGEKAAATKWALLSKSFLPWVRTDLSLAMVIALHPPTTDHDFKRG